MPRRCPSFVVRYAIATQGIPGTPKSEASSNRVVPLAGWLADELRDYLTNVHPFPATVEPSKTVRLITFRTRRCSPVAAIATRSIGRSRFTRAICTKITFSPSARCVARVRKFLRSAAQLRHHEPESGEHYMQVSKWLGHSTFVLTLTTYADYIREDELVVCPVFS